MTSRHEKAGNTLVTLHIFRLTVPFDIWPCSIEQYTKISKPNGFLKKSDLRGPFGKFVAWHDQNQNQNSLLVKRQNDNTYPGAWPRKISP